MKRIFLADVLLLAGLYTARLVAGGVASAAPVSPWLAACSMSGFSSLALLKRYAELQLLERGTAARMQDGRTTSDMGIFCAASGS